MKRLLTVVALCVATTTALAERATTDLISYAPPPAGWKKEVKAKTYTSYTITNQQDRSYCQIFVMLGTASKGDLAADFDSEWHGLVAKQWSVTQPPQVTETDAEAGWRAKAGIASFAFDGGVSMALLTTISGHGRTMSIVAVTNSETYAPAIQAVLASVKMNKDLEGAPEEPRARSARTVRGTTTGPSAAPTAKPGAAATPTALQGYMEYSPFTKTWTWKLRYPQPVKK